MTSMASWNACFSMSAVENAVTLCADVLQVDLAPRRRDDDFFEPARVGVLGQRHRGRVQRCDDCSRQR